VEQAPDSARPYSVIATTVFLFHRVILVELCANRENGKQVIRLFVHADSPPFA